MRRLFLLFELIVAVAFTFHSCTEKLPEGPGTELEDVLKVELTTDFDGYAQENTYADEYQVPDGMTWVEFNVATAWKVYFRVRVYNVFDEPVVGTKYIDARIRVWDTNDTTQVRTLAVLDTLSTDAVIIHPGDRYTVFSGDQFVWDQTDDDGEPFARKETYLDFYVVPRITYDKKHDVRYRHCDTLFSFWADSVIAFIDPIHIKAQAMVQLFREYKDTCWESEEIDFTITYLSHEGWTPVTAPCKEGYVVEGPPP